MKKIGPFYIDEAASDDEYLYVDVDGLGSVAIKRQPDGIVVDIFALDVRDSAIATCWATTTELIGDGVVAGEEKVS